MLGTGGFEVVGMCNRLGRRGEESRPKKFATEPLGLNFVCAIKKVPGIDYRGRCGDVDKVDAAGGARLNTRREMGWAMLTWVPVPPSSLHSLPVHILTPPSFPSPSSKIHRWADNGCMHLLSGSPCGSR